MKKIAICTFLIFFWFPSLSLASPTFEDNFDSGSEPLVETSNTPIPEQSDNDTEFVSKMSDAELKAVESDLAELSIAEPEPYNLPLYPAFRRQDYQRLEATGIAPKTIDTYLSEERAAASLEMGNKLFGAVDYSGIAPFLEQGYQQGKVDLEIVPLAEKLATMEPEAQRHYKAALFQELLGILDQGTIRAEVTLPNQKTITRFFSSDYRARTELGSDGVCNSDWDASLFDTQRPWDKAKKMRQDNLAVKEGVAEMGGTLVGLEIEQFSDSELARFNLQRVIANEDLGHQLKNSKIDRWETEGAPLQAIYYFRDGERPPLSLWNKATRELADTLAGFAVTKTPKYDLIDLDGFLMEALAPRPNPADNAVSSLSKSPQHIYAAKAVLTRTLDDLGFDKFMAERIIEEERRYDDLFSPSAQEEQAIREKIQRNYDRRLYFEPEYFKYRVLFVQGLPDGTVINNVAKRHYQSIFREPFPDVDGLLEIPQEVLDAQDSYKIK